MTVKRGRDLVKSRGETWRALLRMAIGTVAMSSLLEELSHGVGGG